MNEEWKSCVQGKPTNDGKYYVYISNLQVGDELRIMSYEKNHWNCLLEPDERIIAWKKIEEKKIKDEKKWLTEHRNEIEQVFNITNIHINDFEIAESLEECVCKYCSWFHYNQVRLIDNIFVIKVIF